MFKLTINEIVKAVNGYSKNIKNDNISIEKVVIDDHEVEKNCAFIAIVGKKFDGHNFCENAIKKGAYLLIVEKEIKNFPQIIVKNTTKAFLDIAALNKKKFKGKLTGVTGSVGKTTTKDMLGQILEQSFKTLRTYKNLNNEFGLSKTVLNLDETYKAAVVEMGMSNLGEISALSKTCQPDIGIITNIGVSHLEFLKTRENILKAKLEILDGMKKNTPLILNGDDDFLKNLNIKDHKITLCGIKNNMNLYRAKNIKQILLSTVYDLYKKDKFLTQITLPTIGEHNVLNSLLSIAAAELYSVSIEKIKEALKNFVPSGMRQNIYTINEIIVIADFYNASPDSMKASIKTLSKIPSKGRKIAVLGSMLELGDISKTEHQKIGEFAVKNNVDFLYCYGEETKEMVLGANEEKEKQQKNCTIKHFNTKKDLICCLKENIMAQDVILFKASLKMNFEEIFNAVLSF